MAVPWYTGLGHQKENYSEANFLKLLLGGIETASGAVKADCSASQSESFEKVTLDDNTSNPMMLDVAKDGRVFFIDRLGEVKVIKPAGGTVTAAKMDVFTANESGLLGMALDPGFDSNHWLYLYYSPNGENVDRLSRFTVTGDTLDKSSEKKLLDVPVQRAECCHHGGGMVMDHTTGNLWLATGDNTNPFASDGYAPIDEQSGRSSLGRPALGGQHQRPARQAAAHPPARPTAPTPFPAGNLFAPGTEKTKPEIYGMGFRNPFRMAIDPKTGNICWAIRPRRQLGERQPRSAGHGRVEPRSTSRATTAGRTARQQHAVHRLRLRHQDVRARRSTARRRSTTRPTTPA